MAASPGPLPAWLPDPSCLTLDDVFWQGGIMIMIVSATTVGSACPQCGVHSSLDILLRTPLRFQGEQEIALTDGSVGSRTGALLRRSGLSVCSPFPLGVPHEPNRKPVSSPRRVAPSVRISRTRRTCLLRAKSYANGQGRRSALAIV